MTTPPNLAYYRAVEGRWRGTFSLEITDSRAFFRTKMRAFDRMSLLSTALLVRIFGMLQMETSVAVESSKRVLHTTRLSKWGITMIKSVETLVLDVNGRDVLMSATMRNTFAPWRVDAFESAPAAIDEDARHATYRFPIFGTEMTQRGERSEDGRTVLLTQDTVFSHGVLDLRRV